MICINSKEWSSLTSNDIIDFLSSPETEESFFFEFKEDRVDPKKLAEEISAFANTYGGFIFLGITDLKKVDGCSLWNEQRIHTTIHDSITPHPSFDIKKFICNNQVVYVIKVDEGAEPPYITNQGKIFERLGSGSCIVKDSARLTQMYNKHEQRAQALERVLSIPPLSARVDNIHGYIDIGFSLTVSNQKAVLNAFDKADLKSIALNQPKASTTFNIHRIGNSIVFTPGGLQSNAQKVPAHLNNFIEIMHNGSARMRILLFNNNPEDTSVNMIYPFFFLNQYETVYSQIMGQVFPENFIYAKKYESLYVLNQFQPFYLYEDDMINNDPKIIKQNEVFISSLRNRQETQGIDNVITNDRIPKTGLYTIDKHSMQQCGIDDYTSNTIIHELFFSQFVEMSLPSANNK